MNKPHVHAEFIKAKADGAAIQERVVGSLNWLEMPDGDFNFFITCEYRIKPEREYPVTSLSMDDLYEIYAANILPHTGVKEIFVKIANAAIKQHIIDTENK